MRKLISRNFCKECVKIKFRNFYTVKLLFLNAYLNCILQNVLTGKHEGCGHDSSLDMTNDLAHSGIKVYLPGFKNELPLASG